MFFQFLKGAGQKYHFKTHYAGPNLLYNDKK